MLTRSHRHAYLTPEILTGDPVCFQLSLPVRLFEFVLGSLLPLTDVDNWEEHGSVTPEEAAEYFDEWVYDLLDQECIVLPPRVYRFTTKQASQTIAHNTVTTVTSWVGQGSSNAIDSSDLSKFVAPVTGDYFISVQIGWLTSASAIRNIRFFKNGNTGSFVAFDEISSTLITAQDTTRIVRLEAGDYLQVAVFQNSGANLDVRGHATIPYSYADFYLLREL